MGVRRIVANAHVASLQRSKEFYAVLGLEPIMDHGWIVALGSEAKARAQINFVTRDATAPVEPDLSIEVDDADAVYALLCDRGAEIVHPIQDETWGVRRFFVRDPDGLIVNILHHL